MEDSRKPPVLVIGIAILSVLIVLGSGFLLLGNGSALGSSPVTELKNPSSNGVSSSCAPFNIETLQNSTSFAFSGTVRSVESNNVIIDVDTVYRGNVDIAREGAPEQVSIPQGESLGADGSSIVFTQGQRYLVAVNSDNTVLSCGFTGVYSQEFAQEYERAFSQDVEG